MNENTELSEVEAVGGTVGHENYGDRGPSFVRSTTAGGSGAESIHAPDPEPWPEKVDGGVLLGELARTLARFVVLPSCAQEALALWVLHTYAFQLRDVTAYVAIESPEKRCGKTTLLSVLEQLVHRPVASSNISPSAFFRVIKDLAPTLLIDEADTFLRSNEQLRGILNSGYSRQTAYVLRAAARVSPKAEGRNPKEIRRPKAETALTAENAESTKRRAERTGEYTEYAEGGEGGDLTAENAENAEKPRNTRNTRKWAGMSAQGAEKKAEGTTEYAEGGEGGDLTAENAEDTKRKSIKGLLSPALSSGGGEGERGAAVCAVERFSCWCPKVMAAIGRLPDTLADRCIVVRMQRKTAAEQRERSRLLDREPLVRMCARFVLDHAAEIASARPEIPAELNDRAADIWEPLLALADIAGGDWPVLGRRAAVTLAAAAQESSPVGSLLLDILVLYVVGETDRLFTRELVLGLNESPSSRPWMELLKGKAVTDIWLAQQLRPYGIRPTTIWSGEVQAKGYLKEDFRDAFKRYIPRSEVDALRATVRKEEKKLTAEKEGNEAVPAETKPLEPGEWYAALCAGRLFEEEESEEDGEDA